MKSVAITRRWAGAPVAEADRLSREELRRLARAERRLGSADPATAAGARREILELERRRVARADEAALAASLAETAALARARGETVRTEAVRIVEAVRDERGAPVLRDGLPVYRRETTTRTRIASRGGLQLAFERGDLDDSPLKADQLYEAGKTYRLAFETSSALRTAARDLSMVSAHAGVRSAAGPQDAVFAAGEILRTLRQGLSEGQRRAADLVCGLDLTVSAAAGMMKADPRTVRRRLVDALTIAVESRRGGARRDRENAPTAHSSLDESPEK